MRWGEATRREGCMYVDSEEKHPEGGGMNARSYDVYEQRSEDIHAYVYA